MSNSLWPHGHTRLFLLHYLLEFAQIYLNWVGFAISPSCPLSPLLLLPSIFPSIRVFSSESALCIRWPKYWSFSFSISPSNEYSGLISFRMDWLDFLTVQGSLKSLLQHHNSKASILQCSSFLMVHLSHPYMTTGETIALIIRTFVSKAMSLLFNTPSRFVIAFLPKRNCLSVSWLQSLSAVILEPKKIKSVTASTFFPSVCHEVMGLDAMILVFWMLSFKPAFSPSTTPDNSCNCIICFCQQGRPTDRKWHPLLINVSSKSRTVPGM